MAQNLLRLPPERNDTSGPSDSLLHAAADESGADITPLQHSHLQIPGWQGSSASFNYEWQPFISCLLIRWVDAIAPPLYSSTLFLSFPFFFCSWRYLQPAYYSVTHHWGEKGVRKNYVGAPRREVERRKKNNKEFIRTEEMILLCIE